MNHDLDKSTNSESTHEAMKCCKVLRSNGGLGSEREDTTITACVLYQDDAESMESAHNRACKKANGMHDKLNKKNISLQE